MKGSADERVYDKFQEKVKFWRINPDYFFAEALGRGKLDPIQIETLYAIRDHDRVKLQCANEVGKTYILAGIGVWFLICFGPRCSVIATSTTDRQLWRQFWPEVKTFYHNAPYTLPGRFLEKYWEINPTEKWFMIGFATRDEVNFEGWHNENILLIFDEAKGIIDPIWQGGERLLRGEGGIKKWIVAGTPPQAPIGEFCQLSLDPRKAANWKHLSCTGWESPRVSNKECQKSLDIHTKESPFYQSMVMGQIPTSSEETIINMEDVEAATQRTVAAGRDMALSIDVARQGPDETVITIRWGWKVKQEVYQGKDRTTWAVGRIKKILEPYEDRLDIPIFVDDTGVGGGVTDDLLLEDYNAIAINFGGASNDPDHYYDWGTEMFATLGKHFKDQPLSIPNDPLLKAQLWSRTKIFYRRKGGKIVAKILSKEELKKDDQFKGMKSPDRADSLALVFSGYPSTEKRDKGRKVGSSCLIRGVKVP